MSEHKRGGWVVPEVKRDGLVWGATEGDPGNEKRIGVCWGLFVQTAPAKAAKKGSGHACHLL